MMRPPRILLTRTSRIAPQRCAHVSRHYARHASSAAAQQVVQTPAPATPLHQSLSPAAQLLGRIGSPAWQAKIVTASLDLAPRRRRIAVYGSELAAPYDVVSAILRDPLDDPAVAQAIMTRAGEEAAPVFRVSPGEVTRGADELLVPSPWLEKAGSDLFEVVDNEDLVRVDLPVVVVDPYTLSLPADLPERTVVIVNGPLPPRHSAADVIRKLGRPAFITNAALALEALDSANVDTFQHLYLASGIGAARTAIASAAAGSLPEITASSTLAAALADADAAIKRDIASTDSVLRTARHLRQSADAAVTRAEHLGTASKHLDGGLVQGSIEDSGARAARAMQALFDSRLSWLSLLLRLRVDDVADDLAAQVAVAFADVEQQLVFEAGQVAQLQHQLGKEADGIVKQSEIRSATLINRLASLSLSTPSIDPFTLTEPIRARRATIIARTIPVIQQRAQRILFSSYLASLTGAVSAWVAYVPPLELLSASSSVAVGLLSVVGSVFWGQRRWAKAQRHFWADWSRSTKALRGDVTSTYKSSLRTLVVAKPYAAAEGLETLARKRIEVLEGVASEIHALRQ